MGEREFKPESYIHRLKYECSSEGRMFRAHQRTSGGYISGEVKVAIALRILAGASYLDVGCIFGVHHQYVPKIFLEVISKWFSLNEISPLALDENLDDEDKLVEIASQFSNGRCPSFTGVIGALDGWLVRIRLSALRRWLKVGTGGYWSRKGFYALNVQVIVDKHKRVLWRSINSKGGEHDSRAFKSSRLWDILTQKAFDPNSVLNKNRFQLRFYLIADSAYALRSFLLTPFPTAGIGTAEDGFNYYHSCNRIVVECAFGEIYARWGIFWRPLQYNLSQHKYIIDAAFRLHNFLVNHRLAMKEKNPVDMFKTELITYICQQAHGSPIGVFHSPELVEGMGGESRGRPSKIDEDLRKAGVVMRDEIRDHISLQGMCRPTYNNWRRNECNFTEMTSFQTT
jgi:hypothetical protein